MADQTEQNNAQNPEQANAGNIVEKVERIAAEKAPIDQARMMVEELKSQQRRRPVSPAEFNEVKAQVSPIVKETIQIINAKAEQVRNDAIQTPQALRDPNVIAKANEVAVTIKTFARAAKEGLIEPPQHEPTAHMFDAVVDKLEPIGDPDTLSANFLQPFLNGLLNEPEYIRFAQSGEPPTKFERDLEHLLINQYCTNFFLSVLDHLYAEHGENAIPSIQQSELQARLRSISERARNALPKSEAEEGQENIDKMERSLLKATLEGGIQTEESIRAIELFRSMENPDKFLEYYTKRLNEAMALGLPRERAAKNIAEDIHKNLMFLTYKIMTPIINGDQKKSYNELLQETAGLYGNRLDTMFNFLKKRVRNLEGMAQSDRDRYSAIDLPFYQYGNETIESYEQITDAATGKKIGKWVKRNQVSSELKKTNFVEFLDNLHIAMEAENDIFQGGLLFNHALVTGQLDQNQKSFFRQSAQIAHAYLPSSRLDELYKLPYHEIIEAAQIALSSYYKQQMMLNRWKRKPEILQNIFSNLDEAQKMAFDDMTENFRHRENPVPEWVIKRALVHARTHLSLVKLEMNALGSYAHAPVTDLGSPSYRDPALKNLEAFKTWYAHEQWRVSDTSLKDMAFMPSPAAASLYKKWMWEDVVGEGKEIYENSVDDVKCIGKLSRIDREYFDWDVAPNIAELNPMMMGGAEIRLGWRMKYPAMSWLSDLINPVIDEERLTMKERDAVTQGWKRLENIGVNVLKMYRDEFLLGRNNDNIKYDKDGKVKYESHYQDFFKFLYRRYFASGVGREAYSMTVPDGKWKEKTVHFKDIANEDQFWNEVVRPILYKEVQLADGTIMAESESKDEAVKRNLSERASALKELATHALTVVAFERMPMDFLYVEDPSRSQNGVTLLNELESAFITAADASGRQAQSIALLHAFNDIVYVQQVAREQSVVQMNQFVKDQNDSRAKITNVFTKDTSQIGTRDRSSVKIDSKQRNDGYVIDEGVIEGVLEKRWGVGNPRVQQAIAVYRKMSERIVQKPEHNVYELNPEVSNARMKYAREKYKDLSTDENEAKAQYKAILKQKFEDARQNTMKTRLGWSEFELLSGQTVFSIHDTAYQFLEFIRSGADMVTRTLGAIADTQEAYKTTLTNDDTILSALKKYYRAEDKEKLESLIVEMRSSIKMEDGEQANRMAYEVLMNCVNVMRINSDCENNIPVNLAYQAMHKKRAAFGAVVGEGPEYPLRNSERNEIIESFLHKAQFPKRAKEKSYELKEVPTFEQFMSQFGGMGEAIGRVADGFFGNRGGKLVRARWKELSGEGFRDRVQAHLFYNLVLDNGGAITYGFLLGAAILIAFVIQGFNSANE